MAKTLKFFLTTLMMIQGLVTQAAELSLHVIPAPRRTNWSTPQSLASSALKNQFNGYSGIKRHSIGHLYVELNCQNWHFYTGSTSTGNKEERKSILLDGYGLGIVLKNFKGKLDSSEEAEIDIRSQQIAGRSVLLILLISESTCQRLTDYWFEYQKRGYHQVYAGLNARPLYGESAGCTAFGTSFLELAGLLDPTFINEWKTKLIIPHQFIGGPLTDQRVSFMLVLLDRKPRWDEDLSLGGIALDFCDPEKMVEWTKSAVQTLQAGGLLPLPWPA